MQTPNLVPEPTTEQLLVLVFEDSWPSARNPFDVNIALGVPPWWDPLPDVWARRDEGPPAYSDDACWNHALALLEELFDQFERSTA